MHQAVAFVLARSTSSRFPGKHFAYIGQRQMLEWTLSELRRCNRVGKIVLAGVKGDEKMATWARSHMIDFFGGHRHQVVTRLVDATEHYKLFANDPCVMVSGDCPLIDARMIDDAVDAQVEFPNDNIDVGIEGVMVGTVKLWLNYMRKAKTNDLVHQFPGMKYERTMNRLVVVPKWLKLSVDYEHELALHRTALDILASFGRDYSLQNVVNLVAGRMLEEMWSANAVRATGTSV